LVEILVMGCVALSVMLTIQSAYTLYIMLYTWDRLDAREGGLAPSEFLPPRLSFTVMLPARHEEDVIQSTIEKVARANYPPNLIEIAVICSADDTGTIGEAQQKIEQLRAEGLANARVVVFDDKPINKPHGLNVGLRGTSHEVVTIFDAEDDIHPDIFQVVNTVMQQRSIRVVQCGVQLMNYDTNWYSTLNVLEYFFWFKSRLHYHARCGTIPLGGNTVFFARPVLEGVGGWDEQNLTEDADIGMRISCKGERVCVVYDDHYVTREETPPNLSHFIKQRTRWSQGFLQTLKKGDWLRLPTWEQRLLALYTLGFPCAQAVLGLYVLVSAGMMFWLKTQVLVAIVLTLPFYLLIAHFLMALVGLYEFTEAHGLKPSWKTPLVMALTYLPYQWVLSYAAVRATVREIKGVNNWEKTKHVGAHRHDAGPVATERPARTEV
jgi:cellulose synthase/poly-beta-1,6-N-acetylglucosamine synthase-like glycosyltransferase